MSICLTDKGKDGSVMKRTGNVDMVGRAVFINTIKGLSTMHSHRRKTLVRTRKDILRYEITKF